jgi:predicted CxxxxCH...CXXCH cytochrome family protein
MAQRFQSPRLVVALAVLAAVGIACAQSEPIEPRPDDGTSGGAGTFGIAGFTGTGTAGSSAAISGAGTTGAYGSIGTTGSAGAKSNNTSGQAGTADSSGSAGTGGSSGVAGSGTGTGGSAGGAGTFGFAGRGGTTGSAGRGGTGGTGGSVGGRGGTTGSAGGAGTTGSPDGGTNPDGGAVQTFTDIYNTILVTYCSGSSCHSPGTQAGVSFASKSSAYTAVHNRVTPGNGSGSAFFQTVNSGSMPRGQAKLSSANLTKIKTWIDQGALNN